jgi:hypothetical protein
MIRDSIPADPIVPAPHEVPVALRRLAAIKRCERGRPHPRRVGDGGDARHPACHGARRTRFSGFGLSVMLTQRCASPRAPTGVAVLVPSRG